MSGIGDRAVLEPLGIPVKHHLPSVGTNVQEHPVHGVHYYSEQPSYVVEVDSIAHVLQSCAMGPGS